MGFEKASGGDEEARRPQPGCSQVSSAIPHHALPRERSDARASNGRSELLRARHQRARSQVLVPDATDGRVVITFEITFERTFKITFGITFKITFEINFEITFKITFEITFKITFEISSKITLNTNYCHFGVILVSFW